MSKCDNFKTIIQNYIAGEIAPSELDSLHKHCLSCADCRALMDLNIEMSELGYSIPEPDEKDFQVIRNRITSQISREQKQQRAGNSLWNLMAPFRFRPVTALSMMVILLITAVFLGRWSAGYPVQHGLTFSRYGDTHGRDLLNSNSTQFDEISFVPGDNNEVMLAVQQTNWYVLKLPTDDDRLTQAAVDILKNDERDNMRLKAVKILQHAKKKEEVKNALIHSLQTDPNPGVRLHAIQILNKFLPDRQIINAFETAIFKDSNSGVRFEAKEYLKEQDQDILKYNKI